VRISRRSGLLVSGIATALTASLMLAPVQAADSSTATSLADFGGLAGLEAACKKEGQLNLIAIPDDWANYGAIKDAFRKKYPEVNLISANEEYGSRQELDASLQLKGTNRAPDVYDGGLRFAVIGQRADLFAIYKHAGWNDIPAANKNPDGYYGANYGGFMTIGYDAKKVKKVPTKLMDLGQSIYKNQVALNGNPATANAALHGVIAVSVAKAGLKNGVKDPSIGVKTINEWKKAGTFIPIEASSATVKNGQTPIVLDWGFLQQGYGQASKKVNWKFVVPTDAAIGTYYMHAVFKYAPHPACARLWTEHIYSDEQQNNWLRGFASPVRLPAMVKKGTVDKKALAKLPQPPAGVKPYFLTLDEQVAAGAKVASTWGK
jgi:putative spermidine/putrescine transport system substrate-binding protein